MGAVVLYRDGLREECLYPYIYRAICFIFLLVSSYMSAALFLFFAKFSLYI